MLTAANAASDQCRIGGEQAIQDRVKRRCSVVTPLCGAKVHIEVRRRRSLERDEDNVRIGCVARHGCECQMTSHLRADQRQRGLGIRGDLNSTLATKPLAWASRRNRSGSTDPLYAGKDTKPSSANWASEMANSGEFAKLVRQSGG